MQIIWLYKSKLPNCLSLSSFITSALSCFKDCKIDDDSLRSFSLSWVLFKQGKKEKKGKNKYYSDNERDKVKVVPVHAMKAYSRSRYTAPLILQLSIRWRWVANFTPQPFYSWKRTPIPIKYEAQWGGLDNSEKRKISCLRRDSNPGSSSPQSGHYTNYAIPASQYTVTKQYKRNYILNSEILKHLVHSSVFLFIHLKSLVNSMII